MGSIILFNSFSLGTIIPTIFFLTTGLFLYNTKDKSMATDVIGRAYIFLGIFNIGYFISSSVYHPAAAFHRWWTVLFILVAIAHFGYFYFFFPENRAPRIAKLYFYSGLFIALVSLIAFMFVSLQSDIIYQFRGHYYDFDAEDISTNIGIIIMLGIFASYVVAGWRIATSDKDDKKVILLFLFFSMIGTIVPSVTNTLSRSGKIDREVFHTAWTLLNLLGFFLMFIAYINNSKDRISFLGKLIGTILVTILCLLQIVGFIILSDKENDFDAILYQTTLLLIHTPDKSDMNYVYRASYSLSDDKWLDKVPDNFNENRISIELKHTYIWDTINSLPDENFYDSLKLLLNNTPPTFKCYKQTILQYFEKNNSASKQIFMKYLSDLDKKVYHLSHQTATIKGSHFRSKLTKILAKPDNEIKGFYDVISEYLTTTQKEGEELKYDILNFLIPIQFPKTRVYHTSTDGNHV
ncbi:MAG: hypothetical protein WBK20_16455, partial [Spirochaetota bacterium]